MSRSFLNFILLSISLSSALIGCTIYESTAHKDLNDPNIVGSQYGMNASQSLEYTCGATRQAPDFLKEPLEVVQTSYEAEGITALYSAHEAHLILTKTTASAYYASCKVHFLRSDIAMKTAAELGHEQLLLLLEQIK